MYPTLFHIGSFRIDTYSVVWFIALSLAILWSIRRLALYNLDEDESRRVMAVSFFFMLIGAKGYGYIAHWGTYLDDPSLFLDLNKGGLHEFGAIAGAFLSALAMCAFSRKISFMRLCDTAVIPAFLAIAIGRWGCFLNGCCLGLTSTSFLAVHFPVDRPGIFRHPVQIYYSVIAAVIILILLFAERKALTLQRKAKRYYSVITPLGIILYVLMRYAVVPFRDRPTLLQMIKYVGMYKALTVILVVMCVWLVYSLLRLNTDKHAQ